MRCVLDAPVSVRHGSRSRLVDQATGAETIEREWPGNGIRLAPCHEIREDMA